MTDTTRDQDLLAIARKHLRLRTLESQGSDSLDFSEHAVWSIKSAFEAAFEAGRAQASAHTRLS
jgi:hypothetical protein